MHEDPKVTRLPPKPRVVPSDNLREVQSDTLASMGLDASVWPHGGDYARRVREQRDTVRAMYVVLNSLAGHCAEIDRELTALLGEDNGEVE